MASIYDTSPEFSSGPLISPSELERLSNLHSLALDFSDLTSELCGLLASPRRTPLHRLSLLLNGAALEFKPLEGTATEDDWEALVMQHLSLATLMKQWLHSYVLILALLPPALSAGLHAYIIIMRHVYLFLLRFV